MKPQTQLNQWIAGTLIFMSLATIGYGQSSIDLTFNNVTSNTVFNASSIHNGKKVYSHRPTSNLPAGGTATLIINVTEISGNPQAELTMWNPNNRNEFWYSPGSQSLTLGQNILTVGPNEAMTYFRYEIKLESGDQLTINSFAVQGYDLVNNTALNIQLFDGSFDDIEWTEEVVGNPANNEIQDYVKGFARINDDGDLVLKIARNNINEYNSSRLNSSPTNIALNSGEKLSVEFEAKLPRPEDINGNFVSNTPIWPALWIMGREVFDGNIGWPYCGEIDAMEWSPTRSTGTTAFSSAYHWNDWDYIESGNQRYNSFNYYQNEALYNHFNKWRVDIYRYDDGINTNKIELFFNDILIPGSRITMNDNNQEFWWPVANRNPQTFNQNSPKNYVFIMNIAMGGNYPGINNPVPTAFDHAEMLVRNVDYSTSSLEGASTTGQTQAIQWSEFDGAQLSGSNFSYPDWAELWAGFQNVNGDVFRFPHGGRISFNARTLGDLSQNRITFTFENDRYPDHEPNFTTAPVTVNSSSTVSYAVDIPAQNADQVFKSFLLKLTNRTSGNQAISISNVTVETFEEAPLEDIYDLTINYDPLKVSINKSPNKILYYENEIVQVEATPLPGYVLGDSSWLSKSILMDGNQTFTISAYNDYNDSDSDGLNNYAEAQNGTDPNDPDSDNDGLNDGDEIANGTDPNLADYTLDLTYDSNKLSVIKTPNRTSYPSGSSVSVEATPQPGYVLGDSSWLSKSILMNGNQTFTISTYNDYNDSDSDGLNNYAEAQNGTDPNNTDSDGDGSNDYFEWVAGTDPNNALAHFKIQNSVIDQETFQLEYDSNFGRNYNILVSSDLNTWTEWKTLFGDGEKQITIFNNQEKINLGIDSTSKIYFFKVDIIKIN